MRGNITMFKTFFQVKTKFLLFSTQPPCLKRFFTPKINQSRTHTFCNKEPNYWSCYGKSLIFVWRFAWTSFSCHTVNHFLSLPLHSPLSIIYCNVPQEAPVSSATLCCNCIISTALPVSFPFLINEYISRQTFSTQTVNSFLPKTLF